MDRYYYWVSHWPEAHISEDGEPTQIEFQNNCVHSRNSAQRINSYEIFWEDIQDQGGDSFSGTDDADFKTPITWPDIEPITRERILVWQKQPIPEEYISADTFVTSN